MATASILHSEEQLLCSICLDLFTDPITTPCGHDYCRACITHYWDTTDHVCEWPSLIQCPLCRKTFDKRPEVTVNTLVSVMVQQLMSQKWKEEYDRKTEAEIQQMIQDRHMKIQEVKHSVEHSKEEADTVIAALNSCIQGSQAELIDVIEEKKKTTEKQADDFIKELQEEITRLEKRTSELKQLSHAEDHPHLLQNFTPINTRPPFKDWSKVSVRSSSCVWAAVAQLGKTLSQEMEKKLCDIDLRRIQQYFVDVTMDTDTAHPWLILSEDVKQVYCGTVMNWDIPDNKERFDYCPNVLGKQSCSSGRFYYEVQVGGKVAWSIGVARESINRKGMIYLGTSVGFWAIGLRDGSEYYAFHGVECDDVIFPLPVREQVQKVGVFVDYEEGLVSFYDVEARIHLYSFTGYTFTERLYPFFTPSMDKNGTNSAPLIISPPNCQSHR